MADRAPDLVARLRAGLDPAARALEQCYERWLREDDWDVADEALPLLVGVDPRAWPAHLETRGTASEAAALGLVLTADAKVRDGRITPAEAARWARVAGVELPSALTALLEFIARVVPQSGAAAEAEAEDERRHAGDREAVLGAALALVTKFPERCRDANGFYDGLAIADLILEKAVVWFPERPPALSREAMGVLIERYLT